MLILERPDFLTAAEPFHAELYADSEKTTGMKLKSPFLEFRTALNGDKTNFAAAAYTKKLFPSLPVTAKAGMLSAGGAISRLNNPALSSGTSPFTTSVPGPAAISAALPSYTSFSKPQSYFIQAELPRYGVLNCFYAEDSASPVISAKLSTTSGKASGKNSLSLSAAAVAGSFYYETNRTSSWFSEEACYKSGKHFCALTMLSLSAADLTANLTTGFYESPFGSIPINLRGDLNYKNPKIEAFLSAFYNPKDGVLTSSQKSIPSIIQLKTGLVTKKMQLTTARPLLIKTGFNIFSEFNLINPRPPVTANLGIQFSDSLKTVSLSSSLKITFQMPPPSYKPGTPEFDSFSLQLKNTWNLKYLNPGAAASVTFTKSRDVPVQKYKLSVSLTGNQKHKLSANAAYSFTIKDNKAESKKLSVTLSGRLELKHFTFLGKLSATLE